MTMCPLCEGSSGAESLRESGVPLAIVERAAREHPGWASSLGVCSDCALRIRHSPPARWHDLLEGVLPTPVHMNADLRCSGREVTLALVDSGFHPHPDLTRPRNRILAWADAGSEPVQSVQFDADDSPTWSGSADAAPAQWHGLMTSAIAAGNGWMSGGFYRGLAADARLILVQVREADGRITNDGIARALRWLRQEGPALGLRAVSLSVGGDPIRADEYDPVDEAIMSLTGLGVTVLAAAGNDGERRLVPPAASPTAITVGGLDDKNLFDPKEVELWHGNYGATAGGARKPELVAPSIWVVAPLLPGTRKAREAVSLFERRASGDPEAESRIEAMKLVTPHYHHVDGTSVAAPLVAGVVACLLEADPTLTPGGIRSILLAASRPVPGAAAERQGAGALDAGRAVALALQGARR